MEQLPTSNFQFPASNTGGPAGQKPHCGNSSFITHHSSFFIFMVLFNNEK
jgi:hypothetical protein